MDIAAFYINFSLSNCFDVITELFRNFLGCLFENLVLYQVIYSSFHLGSAVDHPAKGTGVMLLDISCILIWR
ncbi:unnamed protein product [Schistosoma bovis]|nr:unnamed protein product [Schistosoma bovis]